MANKKRYTDKLDALPTHILIPEDPAENEQIMYTNWDGEILFIGGFVPIRGKSYRLVSNTDFETYVAQYKPAK